MWVKAGDVNISNGKLYDKFSVQSIEIENGEITALTIYDETTRKVVFDWKKKGVKPAPTKKPTPTKNATTSAETELKTLKDVYAVGEEKGYTAESITVSLVSLFGVQPNELSVEQIQAAYEKMQTAKRRSA